MLQQPNPEDYVIATGRQETVRRFIDLSAQELGWSPTTTLRREGFRVVASMENPPMKAPAAQA